MWLCKDTNLKANHNISAKIDNSTMSVCDSAKILIWKQITTRKKLLRQSSKCMWLCKDTNLKANHNTSIPFCSDCFSVCDSAKILIWKQITTRKYRQLLISKCMWLCKDTNLKANHNRKRLWVDNTKSVCDSAKILIWKQITTHADGQGARQQVYVTLQRY